MKKYVIFGVSAFLSDILDIIHARGGRVAEIFLNLPEIPRERLMGYRRRLALAGYEIRAHENLDHFRPREDWSYALGTPSPHKNKLVEELKSRHGLTFDRLIHPTAVLGSNARVGEGAIINVNATVGPNAVVGDFCVINRCASIGHETKTGRHSLLGPNAVVAGAVTIGECSTIAIRATVIDRIEIGEWTVIGAGALVTKDIPSRVIAYGVPARVIRENPEADFQQYKDNRYRD